MTDKNNHKKTPEHDASTKNEAKKAGTFDGDPRNLPPVKPARLYPAAENPKKTE